MNDDSLLTLIFNASIPVQLVMLLLLGASVLSWALMYEKRGYIRQSQAEARDFEGRFWSGLNLSDLFSQLSQREERRFGLEAIFENGFREFARARKAELRNSESVRSAHRAMKVAMAREFEMLEHGRFGQPLCRVVWHRVGDHGIVSRACRRAAGYPGDGGAWYFRGVDRDGNGPAGGDPGGRGV